MKDKKNNESYVKFVDLYSKYGVLLILVIVFLICSFSSPAFLQWSNILSTLNQAAITMVLTCGMTMLLISGHADLSAGSIVALTSIVCALTMKMTGSAVLAIGVSVLAGIICGLLNGMGVCVLKISFFIITLATTMILRGMAYILTDGAPIYGMGKIMSLGQGSLLGIPNLIWIAAGVIIVTFIILSKTVYGRYLYAIGGNPEAAVASGINVKKDIILAFIIMGMISSISGIMLAGRTNGGYPSAAEGYEFDAIIAAVLGGTSFNGGVGGVIGSIFGAIIIALINNGMNLVGISAYYQDIVKGVIIVAAVFIDLKTRSLVMKQ